MYKRQRFTDVRQRILYFRRYLWEYLPMYQALPFQLLQLRRKRRLRNVNFLLQFVKAAGAIRQFMQNQEMCIRDRYGSIKSVARPVLYLQIQTLHSSMVLLNRGFFIGVICGTMLYIPVWFY